MGSCRLTSPMSSEHVHALVGKNGDNLRPSPSQALDERRRSSASQLDPQQNFGGPGGQVPGYRLVIRTLPEAPPSGPKMTTPDRGPSAAVESGS